MTTKSSDILDIAARYTRVETTADKLGRVIGVRRLRPAQQLRIEEMAPGLDGMSEIIGADGEVSKIPRRSPLILAACVMEIDGVPIPFPKNRGELDAILDRLDEEGLVAAGEALSKLMPAADDTPQTANEQVAHIKNSQGTPRSGKP